MDGIITMDANPISLLSLWEVEIRTQIHTKKPQEDKERRGWPRREVSEETNPVDTLKSDF